MKLHKRFALTPSLILASGAAWGHPGHEAIGDVLHIEYFVAAGGAVAAAVFWMMRHKWDGRD